MTLNKKTFSLLTLVACVGILLGNTSHTSAQGFSIVSVVNQDAISALDLLDRTKLLMVSSGLPDTKENREKLKPQALNSLIEEQIKLQEAKKQNLEVSDEDVDAGFKALADQNKLEVDQFAAMMGQQGIPKSTLMAQIRAQVAWSKVIQTVLRPQVDVSENDINARLERLRENVGRTQYLVGKIYIPFANKKEEAQFKQLSDQIIAEVKAKRTPFQIIAKQFSKSPEAQQGGMMGWLYAEDLPQNINPTVTKLNKGDISKVIKDENSYTLVLLQDKRVVSDESLPSQDEILNQIGLGRLDSLQQKYLADLKSSAFIDNRI